MRLGSGFVPVRASEDEDDEYDGTQFVKIFAGPAFKRSALPHILTCLDYADLPCAEFSVPAVVAAMQDVDLGTGGIPASRTWTDVSAFVNSFGRSDMDMGVQCVHADSGPRYRFVMAAGEVVSVDMSRETLDGHLRTLHDLLTWRDADAAMLHAACSNKSVPESIVRLLVEDKGVVPEEVAVEAAIITGHPALVYLLSKTEAFTRASCVEFAIANIAAVGADDARRCFKDPIDCQIAILKCLLNHEPLWAQVDPDRMAALAVRTHDARVMHAVFSLLESKGCSVPAAARAVLTALHALRDAASKFEFATAHVNVQVLGPSGPGGPLGPEPVGPSTWASRGCLFHHLPFRV